MKLLGFLFYVLQRLKEWPARLFFQAKIGKICCSSKNHVVISFGGVLDHQSIIHGGAVKLLPLRDSMKADEKTFNLLYLVSSAQPRFAEDVVRFSQRRGIPFVWNQNGVGYPAWAGNNVEKHNEPMRKLRQRADYVIYQSTFCRDSAEKFLGSCSVSNEILFNPVNLEKFFPLKKRPSLETLKLLTLGTHGYPDRVLSTLHALKILKDEGLKVSLTIAGKCQWPHAEKMLYSEIESLGLGLQVAIFPAFTQEQAVALYQSHHLVLHPKYLDPCPTVVVEALASGCPVVASASGGVSELVSSNCGYLVPTTEQWEQMITPTGQELAIGVKTILPDFHTYSIAARERAERLFDEKKWVQRHQEIFSQLLGMP